MRTAPLPESALLAPQTNPPADVGRRLDAGAFPGPPQDRPSVIEQSRSIRSRGADLRQRAEGTRQRALALMQETAALMLAAEQIRRPTPRKELLGRSGYARLWARLQTMPVIEPAKGILMAQSGMRPGGGVRRVAAGLAALQHSGQGTGGSDRRQVGRRVPGRAGTRPPCQLRLAARPSGQPFAWASPSRPLGSRLVRQLSDCFTSLNRVPRG